MLIYGHRFISSKSFYHILDIDSISNTPPSSTIHLVFSEENLDIVSHANLNQISLSICVKSITELIYASALDASFIIVKSHLAKDAQKIANEYIMDAKILVLIENEDEIEKYANIGIDGVIFPNAFIKVNS